MNKNGMAELEVIWIIPLIFVLAGLFSYCTNQSRVSHLQEVTNFKNGDTSNCLNTIEFTKKPLCRERLIVSGAGGVTSSKYVFSCLVESSKNGRSYEIDVKDFPGIDSMESGKVCDKFMWE